MYRDEGSFTETPGCWGTLGVTRPARDAHLNAGCGDGGGGGVETKFQQLNGGNRLAGPHAGDDAFLTRGNIVKVGSHRSHIVGKGDVNTGQA